MEKEYKLTGHANDCTRFIQDGYNIYKIDFGKYEDCYRIGFESDWKIDPIYVDPPGGPLINVGYKTSNIEVVKLFYDQDDNCFKVEIKEI